MAIQQTLPVKGIERTHWVGCWNSAGHHGCAIAMINRLLRMARNMEQEVNKVGLDMIEPREA